MAPLVKMPKPCFDIHNDVYYNTAEYVKTVKARYPKEIASKCNRSGGCYHLPVMHHFGPPGVFGYGSAPMLYCAIYQHCMIACN